MTTLLELIDKVEHETKSAGHRMAEDGQSFMESMIERNTPVETHHLRESYHKTPIVYTPEIGLTADLAVLGRGLAVTPYVWTGRVFTEVYYAEFVERGTGLWGPKHAKYMIKPKDPTGVLAFAPYERIPKGGVILNVAGSPKKGGTVFVRYVMHPGSPGAAMFRIGSIMTEAQKDVWTVRALAEWERAVMM